YTTLAICLKINVIIKTEKIIEMKLAIPLFVKNCIISWPVSNPAPITIPQYAKANLNSSLIFKKTTPTYINLLYSKVYLCKDYNYSFNSFLLSIRLIKIIKNLI